MNELELETEGLFRIIFQRFQARDIIMSEVQVKGIHSTRLGGGRSGLLIFEEKCPGNGLEVR